MQQAIRGKGVVHIVDDDPRLRRALQRMLESAGYTTAAYASGPAVIEALAVLSGCMLLDLRMPEMDGLEVLARLNEFGVLLPIIVVTGHGDVPTAVQAMKTGALDFIEKPIDDDRLFAAIDAALVTGARKNMDNQVVLSSKRMQSLSPRERQVLEGIVAGKGNKLIAFDLDISVRTVEVHRTRLLHRLGTHSIAEAIRVAVLASLMVNP
jgi:two-component system, LuxR family, response regulator FixJ